MCYPITTLSFIFPCSLWWLLYYEFSITFRALGASFAIHEEKTPFRIILMLVYIEHISIFEHFRIWGFWKQFSETISMCFFKPTFASAPPASALTGVDRPAVLHQIFKYFYSNLDSEGEAHFPAYNVSQHTKNSWLFCVYQKLFNWVEKSQGGHNPLWSHREPWRYESKAPSQQSSGFH